MAERHRPIPRRRRLLPRAVDIVAYLGTLPPHLRREAVEMLGNAERDALDRAWPAWAHDGQRAPPGDWSTWVLKAGRGFGKTLAGAQWITACVAADARARGGEGTRQAARSERNARPLAIALVGATLDDARRVMVEGNSGLLAVADAWIDSWHPSLRRLTFRGGAHATLFSGASPAQLRGPEHHLAWCDELAKWEKPQDCWDMLQLGLRLGAHPRALVTTTPRAGPVLRAIMADPTTVTTGGATRANPHISPAYKRRVEALYAGTRLGRQELDGELLPDAAGALWSVELIERARLGRGDRSHSTVRAEPVEALSLPLRSSQRAGEADRKGSASTSSARTGKEMRTLDLSGEGERHAAPSPFTRTLIAVDPPAGDGTCGIIACAREGEGPAAIAHVLADHSVTARSPEGWARAVAAAAAAHGTIEVVAEANQGGRMVKAVLHAADAGLQVRLVTARVGKALRAEPVAHLFEAGRVRLHGRMPELEAQLLGLIAGGGYEGPGPSPDRADAMVWGVGEVARVRGVRVRGV